MIRVSVQRDRQNRPVSVKIEGHALFAAHGHDIVCAAVSMLVQTVVFALQDLLDLKPPLRMEEGYLLLSRPLQLGQDKDKEEKYYLLVETLLLGLQETARAYSANLSYSEVSQKGDKTEGRMRIKYKRKGKE
ncbi:MAG: ribosomal-processing cysteine protease Prp [Bacillota bacterium]